MTKEITPTDATTTGDEAVPGNDAALEELLGRASPRPAPPARVIAAARAAVREEWQRHTRRRRLMRVAMLATAASVVLAVALVVGPRFASVAPPAVVASLEKSIGTVYMLGERSELHEAEELSAVKAGETIVTARGAGVGLRWKSGGSLRLGENTEVRFASADSVELLSGRVYFDSAPLSVTRSTPAPGAAATLTIVTALGDVRHVGTRFITSVDNDTLTVRVREGRVAIDGRYYDATAKAGEQMTMTGSRRPDVAKISVYGAGWEWVEATAPVASMDGRNLYDFLAWVSRETGLAVSFASDAVEEVARTESVRGDLSDAPRDALRQSLTTADLAYDIDNGVINVRQAGH